jgi:hypothetical protein
MRRREASSSKQLAARFDPSHHQVFNTAYSSPTVPVFS